MWIFEAAFVHFLLCLNGSTNTATLETTYLVLLQAQNFICEKSIAILDISLCHCAFSRLMNTFIRPKAEETDRQAGRQANWPTRHQSYAQLSHRCTATDRLTTTDDSIRVIAPRLPPRTAVAGQNFLSHSYAIAPAWLQLHVRQRIKPKFHYADFPVTSATTPNSITPTSPKLPRTRKFRASRRNEFGLGGGHGEVAA